MPKETRPMGNDQSSNTVTEIITETYTPSLRELMTNLALEAAKGIPGVGGIVDAAEKVCRGLAKIEQQERENRLKAYVKGLAPSYVESTEFREEDVLSIMRKLAEDDEAAKTEFYSRLTISLGRTSTDILSPDLRYHFIRMTSGLTCYQIAFAQELQVRKTVPVCGTVTLEEAELAHTSKDSGMVIQAVNTLRNWGLIKEIQEPPRAKPKSGQLYSQTEDFHTLMGLLFHPGDFEPEVVGLQAKEKVDVIIVQPPHFAEDLYTAYLPSLLQQAGLTVEIVPKNSNYLRTKTAKRYLHTGMLDNNGTEYIQIFVTGQGDRSALDQASIDRTFKVEKRNSLHRTGLSPNHIKALRGQMDSLATCVIGLIRKEQA